MHRVNRKVAILLIMVFLVIASIVGIVSYGDSHNRYISEMRYQFFCEKVQEGISKEEIKTIIDEYGSNSWRDDNITGMTYVYFDQPAPRKALGNPIVLGFKSDGTLRGIGSRYKLGDEMAINCDK